MAQQWPYELGSNTLRKMQNNVVLWLLFGQGKVRLKFSVLLLIDAFSTD